MNNLVRGFEFIIVYDEFYFFIIISGEYVSLNQCFENIFI